MEQTLAKGKQIQDDCAAVVKKLRAMLHSTEEQLRVHKKQTMFLTQLTAKTIPKGLHCLPLRLTTEYYTLNSSQQHFPNQEKLEDPQLYHYALFSDNVLAAAVVVNSTIRHAKVITFALDILTISFACKEAHRRNFVMAIPRFLFPHPFHFVVSKKKKKKNQKLSICCFNV